MLWFCSVEACVPLCASGGLEGLLLGLDEKNYEGTGLTSRAQNVRSSCGGNQSFIHSLGHESPLQSDDWLDRLVELQPRKQVLHLVSGSPHHARAAHLEQRD